MKKIIQIHPNDNVAVSVESIQQGDKIALKSLDIISLSTIPFGHKIALKAIEIGEKIIKYGVPIGSASKNIAQGEHIHTHNLQSLYMNQFSNEK